MSLFEQWKEVADRERPEKEYNEFWNTYLEKEKKVYEYILEKHNEIISGKLSELAQKFDMDAPTFAGFMDGINTSLVNEVSLDSLSEDFDIKLEVEFEKLFYNMLEAKAAWLYGLPQWEGVLPKDKRDQITKDFNRSKMAVSNKIGRNDPCPCGSGKKYKKCCG